MHAASLITPSFIVPAMRQELRLFLTALQFFTRIPAPAWVGHSPAQLNQAARYLPLVGIVVGTLSAATLCLCAQILPLALSAALAMSVGILLTGAFHEDGLSDFVDGMGGGYTKDKALAIMKDSRIGAYGSIAIVLVLLLKFQSLIALLNTHTLWFVCAALIAAQAFSRLMAVSIMLTQHYIREDDSARAKPAAQNLSMRSFSIALLSAFAALALLSASGAGALNLVTAVSAALLMRIYLAGRLQKRLGGYTGDCLGAVQQLTELGFFLGLLAKL
jgi:adenosylcobinamide-GDP ribazoletransferase